MKIITILPNDMAVISTKGLRYVQVYGKGSKDVEDGILEHLVPENRAHQLAATWEREHKGGHAIPLPYTCDGE